jgi:hypothetical protein
MYQYDHTKAQQLIARMRDAQDAEEGFDPAGLPQVLRDKMLKSFAEQYVTAAVEAGRMLILAVAEIKRLENREPILLSADETKLALKFIDPNRTIVQVARDVGMSPHHTRTFLRRIYQAYGVRSRPELAKMLRKIGDERAVDSPNSVD